MNKKLFGGALAMLMLIGMASAVMVDYLSNTVEDDIAVTSPLLHEISDDNVIFATTPITMTAFGGETKNVWLKTTNQADATITGSPETTIKNYLGISCADISVYVDITDSCGNVYNNVVPCCTITDEDGDGTNETMTLATAPYTWIPYGVVDTAAKLTFNQYAFGTYYIDSRVI